MFVRNNSIMSYLPKLCDRLLVSIPIFLSAISYSLVRSLSQSLTHSLYSFILFRSLLRISHNSICDFLTIVWTYANTFNSQRIYHRDEIYGSYYFLVKKESEKTHYHEIFLGVPKDILLIKCSSTHESLMIN